MGNPFEDLYNKVNGRFHELSKASKQIFEGCEEIFGEVKTQLESIVTEKHVFNIDSDDEKSVYSFYLDEAPQKGSVRVVVKGKILTVEIKHNLKDNRKK